MEIIQLVGSIVMGLVLLVLVMSAGRYFSCYIRQQRGCKFREVMEMACVSRKTKLVCRAILTIAYLAVVIPLKLTAVKYGLVIVSALWVPLFLIYVIPLVTVGIYTLATALYYLIKNVLTEIWWDILIVNDGWLAIKKRFTK